MSIIDSLKKYSAKALEKSVELGKTAKLKVEIINIESKISDVKKEIGDYVYENNLLSDDEDMSDFFEKIKELEKKKEDKEKELEEI